MKISSIERESQEEFREGVAGRKSNRWNMAVQDQRQQKDHICL